ncbi:sugar MFS transporter [Pseudomonas sp. TE3610]
MNHSVALRTHQPARAVSSQRFALTLVTTLFLLWGLSHGMLDVLNKHFQDTLNVSKAQSGLIQAVYFGAYFVVALPIGIFMERRGYKAGILVGLGLFALGALMFMPATALGTFSAFLLALFVLACGLGCLETAANLYAAVLGSAATAERRLNLAQSFNGLGVFIGPLIGGALFFAPPISMAGFSLDPVMLTYVVLAAIVLMLMMVFSAAALPEMVAEEDATCADASRSIWSFPHFTGALIAQFCYMAAQVGVGAFFINYVLEHWPDMTSQKASYLLSIAMLTFMAGRFVSTWLMRFLAPRHMLMIYGLINVALSVLVIAGVERVSVCALVALFYFMSIMYPCIFAMGVKNLGVHTKKAGAYLVMTLVGGAIAPCIMGLVADLYTIEWAYAVPLMGFLVVSAYAWRQPSAY